MTNRFRFVAVAAALALLTACGAPTDGTGASAPPAGRSPAATTRATPSTIEPSRPGRTTGQHSTAPARHVVAAAAVHVSLFEGDGMTYGVGMPVIVRFTRHVTDHGAFEQAAKVLLNGRPTAGAWAWDASPAPGFAEEAHYRLANFWPAHSHISVDLPLRGLRAGKGLVYDDNLTLAMTIGAAHVSTVNYSATDPSMTVTSDGRTVRTLPVSLGDAQNATYRGTKVVEEFDRVENMEGTPVPWSVRITTSGEFVHAAPWNGSIGRANLSHGCTNLSLADAEWFYRFSQLGDVVQYPNAPGELTPATDGIADWNVPWGQWRTGPYLG